MTLGMMMSLTYIIGQLSAPVSSFIGFAQQFQDAKISLERLNEVHGKPDEEQDIASKLSVLPEKRELKMCASVTMERIETMCWIMSLW